MAIQLTNYVSGRIGGVVFYQRLGQHIARSLPTTVKQSTATRRRSLNFGVACRAAKTLRTLLAPVIPFPKDKAMQNRFAGAIAKWMGQSDPLTMPTTAEISFVTGFSFNDQAHLPEKWSSSLVVTQPSSQLIEVNIPPFIPTRDIPAPAHTTEIKCTIAAAVCQLASGEAISSYQASFTIPYTDKEHSAEKIELPVSIVAGSMVVVAVGLEYFGRNGMESKPAFMPCGVVNASFNG